MNLARGQSGFKLRSLRRYSITAQPLVRLVCFPWCGAGASVYRKLAQALPAHVDVLAVQLPGREDRFAEARLARMEEVVEHLLDDMASVFDRSLVFFGHSMGAMVAYEVARAMKRRMGREPDLLVLSGHDAPTSAKGEGTRWHLASDEDFVANLRTLGGTPPQLLAQAELMRAYLPLIRADYEVLETYAHQPDPKLSCPLIVCAGDRDQEVLLESMHQWEQCTTGSSKVHWFSGDHFYLAADPETFSRALLAWVAGEATEYSV